MPWKRHVFLARRAAEVVEAPGLLAVPVLRRQRDLAVDARRGAQNASVRVTAVTGTGFRRACGLCEVSIEHRSRLGGWHRAASLSYFRSPHGAGTDSLELECMIPKRGGERGRTLVKRAVETATQGRAAECPPARTPNRANAGTTNCRCAVLARRWHSQFVVRKARYGVHGGGHSAARP